MCLEETVYYVNRRAAGKAVTLYMVLALTFLLFHFYLSPLISEVPDVSVMSRVLAGAIGICGFILFSALGLVFLLRLFSKQPYLVISARGIYDNASGMYSGAGWIDWSEIADVRLSRYHNLPSVELIPKDRERFLRRFGWIERINRSSRLGYPAVAIRGCLLPVEPAVLSEQIRAYWRSAPGK